MKTVSEYTPEELARFREAFKPAFERYHSEGIWFFPGFFAVFFGAALLGPCPGWVKVVPGLVLVLGIVMLAGAIRSASPKCPACGWCLDRPKGPYCPACGGREIQPAVGFLGVPQCSACQMELRTGKSRRHTIRGCSRCGVRLTDQGL